MSPSGLEMSIWILALSPDTLPAPAEWGWTLGQTPSGISDLPQRVQGVAAMLRTFFHAPGLLCHWILLLQTPELCPEWDFFCQGIWVPWLSKPLMLLAIQQPKEIKVI